MAAQMSPREIELAAKFYFDDELILASVASHLRERGYRRSAATIAINLKAAGYKLRGRSKP